MYSGIFFCKVFWVIMIGVNRVVYLMIINVLKILFFIMLFMVMFVLFFRVDDMLMVSFGVEVLKVMIVRLIMMEGIWNCLVMDVVLFVRQLVFIKMRSNFLISSNIFMFIFLNYGFGCKYNDFDLCYVKNNLYVWYVYLFW